MRVKDIKFHKKKTHKSDGYEQQTPKSLTVEMSFEEATFIAAVMGKFSYDKAQEIFPNDGLHSEVYDCLVGEFINRYFFDGVDDAVRVVKKK